jgi:hypothetical protein
MRPLRTLVNELVERRLWPIALLLLVALLAVPLLLSKSASPTVDDAPESGAAPAAVAAAVAGAARAAAAPGEPVVSVARDAVPAARLRGRAKNPFRQQYEQPVVDGTTSTSTSTATSASQTPAGGGGSTPSGGTQGGGDSGGQTPPNAQPTYVYAAIDVRFGKAGERLRRIEDVPRLTPLPNADHPIVVFLGMRRDRETAVFLVSTDVHVQGLGQCVPSQRTCEAIELREGEAAFLDFTEADGTVEQYELDLDAVTLHETNSEAVAQRAYARVSRAGKLLLGGSVRSSADGGPRPRRLPFRYVRSSGVLHIAPWVSRRARAARAHRASTSARLADLTPAGR